MARVTQRSVKAIGATAASAGSPSAPVSPENATAAPAAGSVSVHNASLAALREKVFGSPHVGILHQELNEAATCAERIYEKLLTGEPSWEAIAPEAQKIIDGDLRLAAAKRLLKQDVFTAVHALIDSVVTRMHEGQTEVMADLDEEELREIGSQLDVPVAVLTETLQALFSCESLPGVGPRIRESVFGADPLKVGAWRKRL